MNQILARPIIIYIIIAILCVITNIVAFIFQFFYYELPCPLCLLQRFGFIAIGLGATLAIIHKPSWKYDAIILTASLYTLIVATRQILLHIMPNDLGYGSTFFGLHFYTWSSIISFSLILLMSMTSIIIAMLGKINLLVSNEKFPGRSNPDYKFFCFTVQEIRITISRLSFKYMYAIIENSFIIITLVNLLATYFECGFGLCPADPTIYLEWQKFLKLFN